MIGPFERLTPWLARTQARIQSPGGYFRVLAAYIVLAFALRLALFAPASQDDAEQLLFAQSLAGGYNPAQPPLYTWLVVAASSVLGPGLLAVLVVKYACLAAIYAFLFLAAREMLGDGRRAALAAMGLWGLHYLAYDALFNYANTLPHAAACAATLWALARLRRSGRLADFALLGLCLGLGHLAKYAYALFAASVLAAALTVASYRRALLKPGLALALVVALVVLAPHLLWVRETIGDLLGQFRARLEEPGQSYWQNLDKGVFKLVNGPIYFLLPLWVFALFCFPRAARPLPRSAPADNGRDHRRLLERLFFVSFAALAFASFMAWAVLALPPAPDDFNRGYQVHLEGVFGNTWRIVLGSMIAFWCGSFANSYVLARMKVATEGRWLWSRTIGSTLVGEAVDSGLFYFIAFWGIWPDGQVMQVALAQYVLKTSWEVVMTPVTYRVVHFLKRREQEDWYDRHTDFNPFRLKV